MLFVYYIMEKIWGNAFGFFFPHEDVMQTQFTEGLILPKTLPKSRWLWVILLGVCTDVAVASKCTHELIISMSFSFFLPRRPLLNVRHVSTSCILIPVQLDIQIFMRTHWSTCSLHKVKFDIIKKQMLHIWMLILFFIIYPSPHSRRFQCQMCSSSTTQD